MIITLSLVIGAVVWWIEHQEIAQTRLPAPCHVCWAADEVRMVHWTRHGWVHDDTGQRDGVTQLAIRVGLQLNQPPMVHPAMPAPDDVTAPLPY